MKMVSHEEFYFYNIILCINILICLFLYIYVYKTIWYL